MLRQLCLTLGVLQVFAVSERTEAQAFDFSRLPVKAGITTSLAMSDRIGAPELLVGSDNQLALVDFADMTIYRANAVGVWQSTFQKLGSGPGEIASIGGMQFDKGGALWISDTRNSRVSVRGPDTKLIREFKTSTPLRRLAPMARGTLVAIASSAKDLVVLIDETGAVSRTIPYPNDLEALNPILRERFPVRINDSLSVLQFRWFNRRIAVRDDGRIAYDSGTLSGAPELITMKLDDKGSVGTRIAPKQIAFALDVAAKGDTLFVLLGSKNESEHGRFIVRIVAATGRPIDRIRLDHAVQLIATTRHGLFGVGETDDGYSLFSIRIK